MSGYLRRLATTGAAYTAASIVSKRLGGSWLPGISFPGAYPGVAFNNFSPRLGRTYNLSNDGKTDIRGNYAISMEYFPSHTRWREAPSSDLSYERERARELWEASVAMTALRLPPSAYCIANQIAGIDSRAVTTKPLYIAPMTLFDLPRRTK